MSHRRIGFLVFDQFAALDLVGPHEAFSVALDSGGVCGYEPVTIGLTKKSFRSESLLELTPQFTLDDFPDLDTIVIPGGCGLRDPNMIDLVANWLRKHNDRFRRVATVCTGAYALAHSGLVDGKKITTHWSFLTDFTKRFPTVNVVKDVIFVQDGKYISSAGVTAGIDLALELIEQDHGSESAMAVARNLVVYLKRSGAQTQLSDLLRLQALERDRCYGLVDWITKNIRSNLTLIDLANQAKMSPRQLNREIFDTYGATPMKLVEQIRLDEAKQHLAKDGACVLKTAAMVGFSSADSFSRAFSRKFGVSPSRYRSQISDNYCQPQA